MEHLCDCHLAGHVKTMSGGQLIIPLSKFDANIKDATHPG